MVTYDYINLGSAPVNEPCVQTTDRFYEIKAFEECSRYIELLNDTYRTAHRAYPPKGCRVVIKRHTSHDSGMYYEVVARYEVGNEKAMRAALWFDVHKPENWPTEEVG